MHPNRRRIANQRTDGSRPFLRPRCVLRSLSRVSLSRILCQQAALQRRRKYSQLRAERPGQYSSDS